MEFISIYKNMEITYGEMEKALLRLKYKKHKKPPYHFAFVNEKFGSEVLLPLEVSPERKMPRIHFAAYSDIMEGQGVLKHKDDLAKMIEKERLFAQQTA